MKRNLLTFRMPTFQGCSCHRKTYIKVLVVLYLTLLVNSASGQDGFKSDGEEEETNWDAFDKKYGIEPKHNDPTGIPLGKTGKLGAGISDGDYLSENFTLSPGKRDSGMDVYKTFLVVYDLIFECKKFNI